ncbi:hypothetical protein THAOC_15381 [Thalassiosira oceanica]|uniref:Uncharacterized protein n=1 Tax=Thalassiosira oceanica TaxID=159749 RepID=K0SG01_THAOC|nr:hypothetical protein THAOC_15381 [Thalassiosira oceanica]|eukprot:EJK63934.1 hypothetical protein THAOC_15381 [Thalassiosira oceanica]
MSGSSGLDGLLAASANLGGGAPDPSGGGESSSSSSSFHLSPPALGVVTEGVGGFQGPEDDMFGERLGGGSLGGGSLGGGLRAAAAGLGGLSRTLGFGVSTPSPRPDSSAAGPRAGGSADGLVGLWRFDGSLQGTCFGYPGISGLACCEAATTCSRHRKKIRVLKDDAFCARVSGHTGFFLSAKVQGRIVWDIYFEADFVARHGLETVLAPTEDWNFLYQQYSEGNLNEEGLDRAAADFKEAQAEVEDGALEEHPSPYHTPGGSTPSGSTPQGQTNWVKKQLRLIHNGAREIRAALGDAQAAASAAASTATSALNASNAASNTASNALTLARSASNQAGSLAGQIQSLATDVAQRGQDLSTLQRVLENVVNAFQQGGTPAGGSVPAATQPQGAATQADVEALRKEMVKAIDRALVASQDDAYNPLPGETVAVFDDALKLTVAHLPSGEIMIDLLSPGVWEAFDTPTEGGAVSAASIAKEMKNQQGLGANKRVLELMASARQKWPQDLSKKRPNDTCFFDRVKDYGAMAIGKDALFNRAVEKRNDEVADLVTLRNERLSLYPTAKLILQAFDNTIAGFLTWFQGQIQNLRDELLLKQCGADMRLCTAEIEKEVWLVLSGIMWAVFEALHKLRSRARAVTDLGDQERFNATFLYTTCQECALLESIKKHQLKEWGPASAAIMQYLFSNSISITLYRSLESRVDAMEEKWEKAEKKEKDAGAGDELMVLEPVFEGASSPVRSRNGPSLAFPPPSGPPRASRPGSSCVEVRPTGSHSGCRKADRGTTAAGEGRRKAVPDQGYGHAGRREAEPGWQDGPTGAHSGRRKADRGYMTNSDEAGRREAVPARDEDGGEGPAHRHQLTSSGLWTGRLDPVEAPHAATGLLRGFLTSRGHRGRCEVRGHVPNLWPFVLHGLGFTVAGLRFRDKLFLESLRAAGFGAQELPSTGQWWRRRAKRVSTDVEAVFLDHEGVASFIRQGGEQGSGYWSVWKVPHVFYARQTWSAPPPDGWEARSLTMSHDELGGSTTASWSLVAWYPPGHDSPPPIQCPPQPHAPLSTRLGDGEWAEPCPPPLPPASYPREVVYSEDGGAVLGCGLFPHDRLDQPVECACRFSPTGFGRRAVTPLEIAALWDVSILVTDRISAMTTFRGLIRALGATPPAKFLQFGADRLLTGGFRGGSSSEVLVVDRPGIAVDPEECKVKESGDDEGPPLAAPGVRSPSPSAMDRAPAPTWNDQDAQKVDNSPVPTHLWEFFFERVYLEECGELPPGWRQALDGFRRFQLRWWRRRKLAGTFREWRLEHYPLRLTRLDTAYVERSPGGDGVCYRWRMSPDSTPNLGRELYTRHWAQLNEMPKFETSRLMAADAIAKAAGPYTCNHPRYIDTFWTWPVGSTLFYWRWPERYQADARDGQPHFLLGDFGDYVRPQAAPKPE